MAQIKNVFTFLKEYNELTNPVISEIGKQKWHMFMDNLPDVAEIRNVFRDSALSGDFLIEVIRSQIEPCPVPDESIKSWLLGKWQDIEKEDVSYREKMTAKNPNLDTEPDAEPLIEILFEADEMRVEAFKEWTQQRHLWRYKEYPRKQGLDIYNELYKLYSDIKLEAESVELVAGDGLVRWRTEHGKVIDHPVLLQKVVLQFNPDVSSFRLVCEEPKTELYSALLRRIDGINHTMLKDVFNDVEENSYDIAGFNNTKGLFERLICVLSSNGKYSSVPIAITDEPGIMTKPVIFLRKRVLGYSQLIDNIIEHVDETAGASVPNFFKPIIGEYDDETQEQPKIVEEGWNTGGLDQDVLLTLEANNEQLKIVKYLNQYGAVLVQGPPGTGKTHTIANLIGHLLSQGKNVLVTSHTEKALTVLKDKVHPKLQKLCISVLSSRSQRNDMDATLFEINRKTTEIDLTETEEKIKKIEDQRKIIMNELKNKNKELLQIRSLEYKDIIYNNTTLRPVEAAKYLQQHSEHIAYIPGPTTDDTIGLPVSIEQISELYKTNLLLSIEEERLLANNLPEFDSLWNPQVFSSKVKKLRECQEEVDSYSQALFKGVMDRKCLTSIAEDVNKQINWFNSLADSQKVLVSLSINNQIQKKQWVAILEEYEQLYKSYESYSNLIIDCDVRVNGDAINEESISLLDDIIATGQERPIGILKAVIKPGWKRLRGNITINGKQPETDKHFQAAKIYIEYNVVKHNLYNKLQRLASVTEIELDINKENMDVKYSQISSQIETALYWHDIHWTPLVESVRNIVSDKELIENLISIEPSTENAIDNLANIMINHIYPAIEHQLATIALQRVSIEFGDYIELLEPFVKYGELFTQLKQFVEAKDAANYSSCYDTLALIYEKTPIFNVRVKILESLETYAPGWAKAVKERNSIHGTDATPNNIEEAWKYRQLTIQLERLDRYDANEIQKQVTVLTDRVKKNAVDLAYEKAWYHKVKNMTTQQIQAIENWRITTKRIGKGTGKRAANYRAEARKLMPLCQSAIPVWIMPLNTLAESFDPKNNRFDVVIIDEASQADILALGAVYLGKQVIVVGDDEQVSPDSIGMKVDEVSALQQQYLTEVKGSHLFDGKMSIYDIAKSTGFKPLLLSEHFRCLPDIINFSNYLSYNGEIRPLRDTSGVNIAPAVVEYRVPNALQEGKINHDEVAHIVSLIQACIENELYANKTFGVISLLGHEQAQEISKQLQLHIDPKEYEARMIQCGTSAQFQGDERDVIFLSMVSAPKETGGPLRLVSEDGNNDMYKKRYNVAASRAKDQLWLVHSLNPEIDLKPEDIRYKLIKHIQNPKRDNLELKLTKTESDFEKQVMKYLLVQGYDVISQWEVGSYRIDLVAQDGDRKVAIECDGEKWHTLDDLPRDLRRQSILERLGWTFIRIRGSVFYRNPEQTLKWLKDELTKENIYPKQLHENQDSKDSLDTDNEESKLIEIIKIRAVQIRKSWNADGNDDQSETEELIDDQKQNEDTKKIEKVDELVGPHKIVEPDKSVTHEKPKVVNLNISDINNIVKEQATLNELSSSHGSNEIKKTKLNMQPRFDFRKM